MAEPAPAKPPVPKLVIGVMLAGVVLIVVAVLLQMYWLPSVESTGSLAAVNRAKANAQASGLATALDAYHREYGANPIGDNNAAIVRALTGRYPDENIRRIKFYEPRPGDQNEREEVTDPWGTPYEITFDTAGEPRVRSAGPDRQFDTADDLVQTTTKP